MFLLASTIYKREEELPASQSNSNVGEPGSKSILLQVLS
jgi:hypothetical protein